MVSSIQQTVYNNHIIKCCGSQKAKQHDTKSLTQLNLFNDPTRLIGGGGDIYIRGTHILLIFFEIVFNAILYMKKN